LLGQSQGRGLASPESRVPTLRIRSTALTCANTVRSPGGGADLALTAPDSWKASIFDDCPLCGHQPLEPVRVDGQLACRTCTGACTICGSACVPGDEACSECILHLDTATLAVPA
jgi:hypothetical protein